VLVDHGPAAAQDALTATRDAFVRTVAGEIAAARKSDPNATFQIDQDLIAIAAVQRGSLARLLQEFEENRFDEQLGAAPTASGTTTLVSKGTVPKIFAVAVENGAITRSQSGTTLTFRGNVGGIAQALAGRGFIDLALPGDPAAEIGKSLSFSVSFDTARGAGSAGSALFTGDRQQLSQWTVRAQVVDRRVPLAPRYQEAWNRVTAGSLTALAGASGALYDALEADPAFKAWLAETQGAIGAVGTDPAAIESELEARMNDLPLARLQASTRQALEEYDRRSTALLRERENLLAEIEQGLQIALEYTSDRPLDLPRTSNIRLIGSVGGAVELTGNASLTWYEDIPAGLSRRERDVQASAEASVRLGSAETAGPFVLSFSGKYLHQFQDSVAARTLILPDTSGTTAVGQIKLSIPVGRGSGVEMPLSVTFASRTELIKEREVRGNVGLTYDLDSLFARFKP